MLLLGIIGAGEFGHFASEVLDKIKDLKLVGVADLNERSARQIAKRYRVPIFKDYRNLLQLKNLDIVMINTPNDLHEKMAIDALKSGKHVFCEKPLALTNQGVQRIFKQAEKSNRLVGVDFVLRQNRFYQLIKSKLKSFGRLRQMTVNNQATESTIKEKWYWDPRRSGGWFLTADIHFYDLFYYLGGSKISSLAASEYINQKTKRTKAITTDLQSENGSQLYIHHNFSANYKSVSCRVFLDFEQAHVAIEGWVPTKMVIVQDAKKTQYSLDTDRETEYHLMVKRGLENLASAIAKRIPQRAYCDPKMIITAHAIAQIATQKAIKRKTI